MYNEKKKVYGYYVFGESVSEEEQRRLAEKYLEEVGTNDDEEA